MTGAADNRARPPAGEAPLRVGMLVNGTGYGYGVFEFVRTLLESLDRRVVTPVGLFMASGVERDLLGPCFDEVCDLGAGSLVPLREPGKGKLYLPNLFRLGMTFSRGVARTAAAIRRLRLDILHVHFYPLHLVGGLACRMTGIPCLWHWHGSFSQQGAEWAVARLGLATLATRIACTSRFVAGTFPASLQKKCVVVYNGVKALEIREGQRRGVLRQRLNLPEGAPLVALFGHFSPVKGHEYYVQAAAVVLKQMPEVRFGIFGEENESLRVFFGRERTLRQMAQDLGVADRVIFAGHLENAPLYMGDCDIICVPTVPLGIGGEGFGLVVAEAMAAGAAVVSTNCGAPPEIIEDGVSGLLVPPWDPQALADAILRLLRDPGCREAMRQAAWRRVHEHFDVGRMAAAMQALYCEMARRGQGGVAGAALP